VDGRRRIALGVQATVSGYAVPAPVLAIGALLVLAAIASVLDALGLPGGAGLVTGSVAALVAPREPSGLPPDEEARLEAVQAADWLGAVVGLVRGGAGAPATPSALVGAIDDSPEVDGEVAAADVDGLEAAFELILPVWEAAGALDGDWRLTPLGRWALPRGLAQAWAADFDAPSPLGAPTG